jgi:hypothetical protein
VKWERNAFTRAVSGVFGEATSEGGKRLTDEERHRILARLHATLAWVGERIPEEVVIDGRHLELSRVVKRFIFDDYIDEHEQACANWLIDKLEERADDLEEELLVGDLTRDEAEAILRRTVGILRAIDELKNLDDDDEWEDRHLAMMEEVDDVRRWQEFTKHVFGKDEYH